MEFPFDKQGFRAFPRFPAPCTARENHPWAILIDIRFTDSIGQVKDQQKPAYEFMGLKGVQHQDRGFALPHGLEIPQVKDAEYYSQDDCSCGDDLKDKAEFHYCTLLRRDETNRTNKCKGK